MIAYQVGATIAGISHISCTIAIFLRPPAGNTLLAALCAVVLSLVGLWSGPAQEIPQRTPHWRTLRWSRTLLLLGSFIEFETDFASALFCIKRISAAPLVAYLSATWCTCHGIEVHHEVHLPWYRPAVRRQVGAQRRQRRALCHNVATNTYKIFAMRCKASMFGLRQGINAHMQTASCRYATPALCSARNYLHVHSPLVKSTCPRVKATCPLAC